MNSNSNRTPTLALRLAYFGIVAVATIILIGRLIFLQVVHRTDYRLQSDQNRIREVTLKPVRGMIFDRQGELLVSNSPAFSLYAVPYELRENPDLYNRLSTYIKKEPGAIQSLVKANMRGYFRPVRLMREVDISVVTRVEELRNEFPGVGFWVEPIRSYPSGARASHVLGYLGEISNEELDQLADPEYQSGDVIGKKGIEKTYEDMLRGESGLEYLEVDALGREVRKLTNPPRDNPTPGQNIYVTLDADLQSLAEELMAGSRGSIVMLDLQDGGILSMVSMPDFDPGSLAGVISPAVWNHLQNDPGHPLYDRAIQSLYPPGSTYKLVLATAAIVNKTVDMDWEINCRGSYRFGIRRFKCWRPNGHGKVKLLDAIEQSCNVYFWQLSLKVGLEEWSRFSRQFLFGKKTGVDIPLENAGSVPDAQLLDERYGKGKWTRGLLLNLAVGQGDLLVTPLQMVQFVSILANNGAYYRPHILNFTSNPVTGETTPYEAVMRNILPIPEEAYEIVREGMRRVVNGEHGTAKSARVPNIEVAGKTGTAQNPHGDDHAWFIGFAPFDNPKVAIMVMVENGGGGGGVAAPKAGRLLREYFKKYPVPDSGPLAQRAEGSQ